MMRRAGVQFDFLFRNVQSHSREQLYPADGVTVAWECFSRQPGTEYQVTH
jgi:hypothetical protein